MAGEGFEVRVSLDGEDVFARFPDGVCLVPSAEQRVLVLAILAQCMVLLTGSLARLDADLNNERAGRSKPVLRIIR